MTFDNFKWINESEAEYKDGVLKVYAPGHTDYFNSPVKENGAFPELLGAVCGKCLDGADS